jgi:hypothetical protein
MPAYCLWRSHADPGWAVSNAKVRRAGISGVSSGRKCPAPSIIFKVAAGIAAASLCPDSSGWNVSWDPHTGSTGIGKRSISRMRPIRSSLRKVRAALKYALRPSTPENGCLYASISSSVTFSVFTTPRLGGLSIQSAYDANFQVFSNSDLSGQVGLLFAYLWTRVTRPFGAER